MKQDAEELALQVSDLERQMRWTQCACGLMGLMLMGILTFVLIPRSYLRVHGITVVDAVGTPRILIGAPPEVSGRKRTDAQTASIVFLGQEGQDRVIVGEEPNPTIGGKTYPRVGAAYGLLIQDQTGQERGGIANFDIGRSVISLDRPGGDAVEMVENDKTGFAGLTVNYPRPTGEYAEALRLGTRGDETWWALSDAKGTERAAIRLTPAPGKPTLQTKAADRSEVR